MMWSFFRLQAMRVALGRELADVMTVRTQHLVFVQRERSFEIQTVCFLKGLFQQRDLKRRSR